MSSLGQSSRASMSLQDTVLKKVSQLVTSLHSRLLARASNSGVYRDLSEDEEYLLTSLDTDHILHSILAGCLALDSCFANLPQTSTHTSHHLINTLTFTINTFQRLRQELQRYPTHESIQEQANALGDGLASLMREMNSPSLSSQQVGKQVESGIKQSRSDRNRQVAEENIRLKQKLAACQKQQVQLEIEVIRLRGHDKKSTIHQEKSSIQSYKVQMERCKEIGKRWREDKNHLLHEMERLEEQNRILSKYNDLNVYYLLEELQYEVESLKEEKQHDQRIMAEVQMKIDSMFSSRYSRRRNTDSSLATDYSPKSQFTPTRSRRESYVRPPSHLRKTSMMRKSHAFYDQRSMFHADRHPEGSIRHDLQAHNYDDSFMPKTSHEHHKETSTHKRIHKREQYSSLSPPDGGLARIKTTYL